MPNSNRILEILKKVEELKSKMTNLRQTLKKQSVSAFSKISSRFINDRRVVSRERASDFKK